MKYLLVLVHLMLTTAVHAGVVFSGIVKDTADHPLPFVNIGVPLTSTGTVSDRQGQFSLELDPAVPDPVEIRFSAIGYDTKTIKISKVELADLRSLRITLFPKSYDIPMVEITPSVYQLKIKGNTNSNARMQNNMAISDKPDQNLGMAVGRKFRLGKKVTHLSKLNFYISHNNFDSILFRIGFCKIESGLPGLPITDKLVIKEIKNSYEGWVEVDLEPYNIAHTGNIIVKIEWVGSSVNGSLLTIPITVPAPGAIHYYRFGSQNRWKRYPGMSVAMNLEFKIPDEHVR